MLEPNEIRKREYRRMKQVFEIVDPLILSSLTTIYYSYEYRPGINP